MPEELTKSERKMARELISKGIDLDFRKELFSLDSILQQWENGKLENRECFVDLYNSARDFNKSIA